MLTNSFPRIGEHYIVRKGKSVQYRLKLQIPVQLAFLSA